MVTYKLQSGASTYPGQWLIVASYGTHLRWVVGHYNDKRRAADRLSHIRLMAEAQKMAGLPDEGPGAAVTATPG